MFRLESEIMEYLKRMYYFAKRIAKLTSENNLGGNVAQPLEAEAQEETAGAIATMQNTGYANSRPLAGEQRPHASTDDESTSEPTGCASQRS
jgi:hypothetical protein